MANLNLGYQRLGLLGVDSSHARHFVRLLNVERRLPELRVTSIADSEEGRARDVAAYGGVASVVATGSEILADVDAVIVAHRHGGLHTPAAEPFLAAGIPVYIDKPIATSLDSGERTIDLAKSTGCLLTSFSPLRWLGAIRTVDAQTGRTPAGHLEIAVHADRRSPHGGLFFSGIHLTDILCRLLGGRASIDTIEVTDQSIVVAGCSKLWTYSAAFLQERLAASVSAEVTVTSRQASRLTRFTLDNDYLLPSLSAFSTMLSSAVLPISYEGMLAPLKMLETIANAIPQTE